MPSSRVNDAQHWRERAAHMRALSLMMSSVEAQAIMQRLANDYDELADRAATRKAYAVVTYRSIADPQKLAD
jgi:hypothetical protein